MLKPGVRFRPADLLTALFAGTLLFAGLLRWEAVGSPASVGLVAVAFSVPFGAAAVRARVPWRSPWRIAADFAPLLALLLVFDNLGPFIRALSPVDRDAALVAFDRMLFGSDPTRVLEAFSSPLLSDVLTVCYALYYLHPLVLATLLCADDLRLDRYRFPAEELPRFAFTILLTFYASYAGYFAFPATGPRYNVRHDAPLPRGAVSAAIDGTLDRLEKNKRDCFPSGHTMVTVAVLVEARRRSRATMLAFLPFALGLLAATVYGRYHYVADVLAGLALTALLVPLGRRLYDALAPRLAPVERISLPGD